MRLTMIFPILFWSFATLADTQIQLTCTEGQEYNYEIVATLTANSDNPFMGKISSDNARNGQCSGVYMLDLSKGMLSITFDGLGGPGTGGGCHNESMAVMINAQDYGKLMGGMEVPVTFKSSLFYNQELKAMVKIVG